MARYLIRRSLLAVASLSVSLCISLPAAAPAAPAAARSDDSNLGEGTGGDIDLNGNTVPAEVQEQERAKADLAAAYRDVLSGEQGAAAEFKAELEAYEAEYGSVPQAVERSVKRAASRRDPIPGLQEQRILAVTHWAQDNNYFCGPASGKMILDFLDEGPSAYNGATQNQTNIGGTAHMQTVQLGKTPWDQGVFRIGMNRWREGQSTGFYVDKQAPSVAEFKNALFLDIQGSSIPFAASTVEWSGQAHYNGHPVGQEIGHWIVVHGFDSYGNKSKFADPSTSVWSTATNKFTYDTSNFVNTFVSTNGITW